MTLKGNPVSPGIALGKAYIYKPFVCNVPQATCAEGQQAAQTQLLANALAAAGKELDAIISSMTAGHEDKAKIFSAHREILADEEILEMAQTAITAENKTAESAVYEAFEEFIQLVGGTGDATIASRSADFEDVRNRIIRIMRGLPEKNLASLQQPVIVVAHDLLPSDTATLDRQKVLGIITETGGATSHSAIIANSYRIPAVLGVPSCTTLLQDGQLVGLNATTGEIIIEPDPQTQKNLEEKQAAWRQKSAEEQTYLSKPATMADGALLQLGINIGSAAAQPEYAHSDFVGLFRTEFLYMENDHLPTEEEQFAAYTKVLQHANGKPVTLRTLDIGGDKTLPYMALPKEDNPFLGNRALRLCFSQPELLRTQLRAALRASAQGELWVMLPMVGSIDDIARAKTVFEQTKTELQSKNIPFGSNIKFGIMIEIPAIASIADLAAEEVDFASIGTNDLCQYLCAADRMNPEVDAYYQTYSPAMVRTLSSIISAFNKAGKPISVCGEMAGDVPGALLLAGLGLQKLSMSPSRLARVKAALAKTTLPTAQALAQKALAAKTQAEVLALYSS